MPTYEYRCNSCGHQFEKVQKFSDDPIKICPVCGKDVRKVYHPAGVAFKGSGWYINDSRNKGKSDAKSAKPENSVASSDKTEGSSSESTSTASDSSKTESASSEPKTETKKSESTKENAA